MREPLSETLPRRILTWLVCSAFAAGLGALLRLESRWWLLAGVLLVWCALLALADRVGRFWGELALWVAAAGVCLLLCDRAALLETLLSALSRSGASGPGAELLLLLAGATAALPLGALLKLYWFRAGLSLGWTGLWIAAALLEWPVPRLVPAALAPLLLLTLAETIRRVRHDPEPAPAHRRALLLTLLSAAVLLMVLPAPAEPYGYPLLHSAAAAVERIWHDWETSLRYRNEGERQFGLRFNGAGAEEDADGTQDEDSIRALFANPRLASDGALYFFGNSWDCFDGRSWSSTLDPDTAELLGWELDSAEHIYAVWRLLNAAGREAAFGDYYRTNSVYLSYRNMNARTMFLVMNATHVYTDDERFPYANAPTGCLFDYVQKDETWYRVYFLEPNARMLGALIAASEGYGYDAEAGRVRWHSVQKDFDRYFHLDLDEDEDLPEALALRQKLIRASYLDTEGVSERAAALALELTADCETDYEKLRAIAAYLQENYVYTLRPAAVPEGENFLDHLLFEGREGYCTWYATAAVLLARAAGVPARYVQGYRGALPGAVFTALTPANAHAWCEGYVEGYGWVTVEATPGFGGEGSGWLTAAEERAKLAEAREAQPGETDLPPGGIADDEELPVLPGHSRPGGNGSEDEELTADEEPESGGWIWALIPAAMLAALAALWFALRARRQRRYDKADPATRLRLDLERLLRDLRGLGYPRKPEESLRQYLTGLPWRFLPAREAEAEEMAALYDRTFFGLTQPTEAELAAHREFAARFRPRTLRQRIRYWFR